MEVYLDRIDETKIYKWDEAEEHYQMPQEGREDPTSPWHAELVQDGEKLTLTHQSWGGTRRFEMTDDDNQVYERTTDDTYRLGQASFQDWAYEATVSPRYFSGDTTDLRGASVNGRYFYTFGKNQQINYADYLREEAPAGTVHLTLCDVGETGVFEPTTDDEYTLTESSENDVWKGATLEKAADGHFVFTQSDGTRRVFATREDARNIQRIARREDPSGNAITFTYAGPDEENPGALTRITDASGHRYEFSYHDDKNIEAVTIPAIDASWTYTYNERGQVATETDSRTDTDIDITYNYDEDGAYLGRTTEGGDHSVTYDGSDTHSYQSPTSDYSSYEMDSTEDGFSMAATDRRGNQVQVDYDREENERTTTYPDGSKRIDTYNEQGQLIRREKTNPDGPNYVEIWGYDENDYISYHTIDPGGLDLTTSYTRDEAGRVLTRTGPEGGKTNYAYDEDGNLTSRTDPEGNTTTYTYNDKGQRTSRTDPRGNTWTYTYDSDGNRASVTDPEGNTTHYEYDAYGNRTATVDPLGNRTEYEYDADGNLIKKTDPLGNETTYEYNDRDLRTKVTNPRGVITRMIYDERGNVTEVEGDAGAAGCGSCGGASTPMQEGTYTYDDMGNLTSFTDVMGRRTEYEYDKRGNRTKTIRDGGGNNWTTTREYDGLGRVIRTTDSRGGVTEYVYDAAGRRIKTKVHIDQNTVAVTERTYDANGWVIAITDPIGNTATRSYDKNGRMVSATDPLGNSTTRSYDKAGNLTGSTDPLGNTTTRSYNKNGQLTATTDPLGNTVTYTYDAAGRRTQVTDKNGETTTFSYDAAGRMTHRTDPRGNTTSFAYDAVGNRTKVTDPDGNSTFYEYTAANRVKKVIDAQGNVTTYERNEDGSVAKLIDAKDRETTYEYDALGRRVKTTAPDGSVTEKKLDGEGNLLWVEDQNGNRTTYSYDMAGRRTEETFADGTTKTYQYDLAGRLTESTDQNGSVITSTYDAAGRLTGRTVNRATGVIGTTEQTFSYDAAGRLTASTDNNDPGDSADDASVSRSYDALGRTTQETVGGRTVSSSYTGSRRTGITYPNGTNITRSYDAAGNLDTVKRDGSTVADYSYNSRNLTTGATFGNGVTVSNQHDNLGRTTGRSYNKDGNTIAGFSYDYDEVGNKLYQEDLRDSQQSELYGYDNRDRLTSWERGELNGDKDGIVTTEADQNWNLDLVGNWDATTFDGVTEQRDHNAVNELTHRENGITADLRYDDNGNLIEDSEYEYAYDAFNRLVEVTRKTNDKVIATYSYDTQNRRTKKKTGSASGPPVSVEYAYDGWQVVEEHVTRGGGGGKGKGKGNGKGKGKGNGNGGGSGGETVRTYTYGNYIDEPITMTASGAGRGGTYYYHTNNLYNVRALTDSSGDVVERYRYTAYGEPTIYDDAGNERQRSAVGNPYMFQGRRMDEETGLYYYRNRYYSAALGRFVTRDPMGYVSGYNLYEYAGGDPVMLGDPYGLQVQDSAINAKEKCRKKLIAAHSSPGQPTPESVSEGAAMARARGKIKEKNRNPNHYIFSWEWAGGIEPSQMDREMYTRTELRQCTTISTQKVGTKFVSTAFGGPACCPIYRIKERCHEYLVCGWEYTVNLEYEALANPDTAPVPAPPTIKGVIPGISYHAGGTASVPTGETRERTRKVADCPGTV